jgi:hypothetical protein
MNLNFWFERERESIEIDRGADCSACKYALLTHQFPLIYPLPSASFQHPPLPINIPTTQCLLSTPTPSHHYTHYPVLPVNTHHFPSIYPYPLPTAINTHKFPATYPPPSASNQNPIQHPLPINTHHFLSIYPPPSALYPINIPITHYQLLSTPTTSHQYTHYTVLSINTPRFP